MLVEQVLQKLELGSSVGEFDQLIDRYFLVTSAFRDFVENRVDIIAGDKGTGKTTIYRYLQSQQKNIPQLSRIEILAGFNPSGNPIFQTLAKGAVYSEAQYLSFWKAYVLSLVGNRIVTAGGARLPPASQKLDALLKRIGLWSKDVSLRTLFSRLTKWFSQVELATEPDASETPHESVNYDDALGILNSALEEIDYKIWVLLDRLDEAFIGYPATEEPALRALFRTYLDLLAFPNIGLKLFVRRDLFRKIVRGGFVNLSHISARKIDITWDSEDLFALLGRRMAAGDSFIQSLGLECPTHDVIFAKVFPRRMGIGTATWKWMLAHLREGTGSVVPRNLLDLVLLAKQEQNRREAREPRSHASRTPLIEAGSLERALARLSEQRVGDTLVAEATSDVAVLIHGLKGGKSHHDDQSIALIFGVPLLQAKAFAEILVDIGLFERNAGEYVIPLLYRSGLNITDVKARTAAR